MHNPLPGFFFMLGSARIPGVALEFGAVDPWGSMGARIRGVNGPIREVWVFR